MDWKWSGLVTADGKPSRVLELQYFVCGPVGQHSKELAYRWDVHATTGEESEYANVSNGTSAARQTSNGVMSASVVAGERPTEVAEE